MTPDGLTICSNSFGPRETMDRLAAAVTDQGMAILGHIDHAAAAATVGLELRPTEVLIFGNPRAGTPLVQAAQTITGGRSRPRRQLRSKQRGYRAASAKVARSTRACLQTAAPM